MEDVIKEIESTIKKYNSILERDKCDYGEGVVEGLEEALAMIKKLKN